MSWIQTFTGKQFWPLDPRIDDICIEDIAHALSNLCRYGGHTRDFYSVAQHCVLVSRVVSEEEALRGLLHDASEAYLVDLPRPIKHVASMNGYRDAEARLERMIYRKFGINTPDPECIKLADSQLLRTEQRDLMKEPPAAWTDYGVEPLPEKITPWRPWNAKLAYLNRFRELTGNGIIR